MNDNPVQNLKMESTKTLLKSENLEKDFDSDQIDVCESDSKKYSAQNSLSLNGSGFLTVSEESTELCKKNSEIPKRAKEKVKKEDKLVVTPSKERKKSGGPHGTKGAKKGDRDFWRFKSKYNNSIGNILRDWMSLIYCILILRMNLIKFVLQKLPDLTDKEFNLSTQILLESKMMYNMIKDAQNFSQDQFLYMWTHLEKLIFSRSIIKKALQSMQMKDTVLRDWRTAATKLSQLQQEYEKVKDVYYDSVRRKLQVESTMKEKLTKLENLASLKDAEYDGLLDKIQQLKKKEVQMKAKILVNMKSYKDLKAKKQCLLNVEKGVDQLKIEQNNAVREYTMKLQSLKSKIEEKDKQIRAEVEEKKNIKAHLEEFGDFSETQTFIAGKI